jgi:hypothetical protein
MSCRLRIAGSEPLHAHALRQLRDRSERLWEWRRNTPIRPVVFDDPGTWMRSYIFSWSTRLSAFS